MFPSLAEFSLLGHRLVVHSYSFFMLLGMVIAFLTACIIGAHKGLPTKRFVMCLVLASAAVFIGSRVLFALMNISIYTKNPWLVFSLDTKGFAIYGGLMLAAVVTIVSTRLLDIDLWRFADAIAPALGVGIAITRVGCYLNGCCFGISTNLPWGVTFPIGTFAGDYQLANALEVSGLTALFRHVQPIHPTQLYELTGVVIATIATAYILAKRFMPGMAFTVFIISYTTVRWINHCLRAPSVNAYLPEWIIPGIYAGLVVFTVSVSFYRLKRTGISD